jgi:hypothetical protein
MEDREYPDYIDDDVLDMAIGHRLSHSISHSSSEYNRSEVVYMAVVAPSLEETWKIAKKWLPATGLSGQRELYLAIYCSLQSPDEIYATEKEADAWRTAFLKKADELQKLLDQKPVNLDLHDQIYLELGEALCPHPNPEDTERKFLAQILPTLTLQALEGDLISTYCNSVISAVYEPSNHRTQVRGFKAERTYFVRTLSQIIFQLTGKWKRDMVAAITSFVFKCNFGAPEVTRCTKGIGTIPEPIKSVPNDC